MGITMYVLNVKYYVKPGMRQAFYDAIKAEGIGEASRAEDGCILYDYAFDPEDPDLLRLFEVWESAEKQKIHTGTPHFSRLGELKAEYVKEVTLEQL